MNIFDIIFNRKKIEDLTQGRKFGWKRDLHDPRRPPIGEISQQQTRELWERVSSLQAGPAADEATVLERAEAVLDAVYMVTPEVVSSLAVALQQEEPAVALQEEPAPPLMSPLNEPDTAFDRFLDGLGEEPAADPIAAGEAAIRDLGSSVKAHWEAKGAVPTSREMEPLRELALFQDIAWPDKAADAGAAGAAAAGPRKQRAPRKTAGQRLVEDAMGIPRRGRPVGSKTVNRKARTKSIWKSAAAAEPAEPAAAEPPAAAAEEPLPAPPPPRATVHTYGASQPTIREMIRRLPATTTKQAKPSFLHRGHKRVAYKTPAPHPSDVVVIPGSPVPAPPPPSPAHADKLREFLQSEVEPYSPEGAERMRALIRELMPERIRDHVEFNCGDGTTAFGRLFPRETRTYVSYRTEPGSQGRDLTTVEGHRRALRLEGMSENLLNFLQWTVSHRPTLIQALSPADAADLDIALEFHGGLGGCGPLFWQGPVDEWRAVDRSALRRQFEGQAGGAPSLLPTLDFLRDHRPKAFERVYLIADAPSWGLPIVISLFLTRIAADSGVVRTGDFAFTNAMIELAESRLQVRMCVCVPVPIPVPSPPDLCPRRRPSATTART